MATTETNGTLKLPEVTPLEGKTTVDDKATFEPERLSYAAARDIAGRIAGAVEAAVAGRPVVVANDAFLADLGNLGTAKQQLQMLTEDYQRVEASLRGQPAAAEIAPEAEDVGAEALGPLVAAIPALATGLQGALGLVSLLREDVDIRGTVTKIDTRAFDIAVASALVKAAEVYVPDLMVVQAPLETGGSLMARLRAMQKARHDAWIAVGPLLADLGRKDTELETASRTGPAERVEALSQEVLQLRRAVEPLTETLTSADRRLSDLQTQWDKPSETTGLTLLARLFRAEALDAKGPNYLHAAVVASGGHLRIRRHLFNMIYGGDSLSAMGGVVARWALLRPDGRFEKGDVVAARRAAAFPDPPLSTDGW
jgi:hypothetical protein